MSDFITKIKSKLFPKPDLDFDDDFSDDSEDIGDIEVDSEDADLVSESKKKNIIIAVFALVASVLVYYILFTEEEVKEDLVKAEGFVGGISKPAESPFKIDVEEQKEEEVAVLEKPSVPTLPDIPEASEGEESSALDDSLFEEDDTEEEKPKTIILSEGEEKAGSDSEDGESDKESEDSEKSGGRGIKDALKRSANVKADDYSDPRYAPIILVKGSAGADIPSVGQEDNLKILGEDGVVEMAEENTEDTLRPTKIKNRENVIAQGKVLKAILETAIDTELEGAVRAIVSRDVYGEVGNKVLISKGSRLYGEYKFATVFKPDSRIDITWTRLIRPDGISVAINAQASDQYGRAGVVGTVDNKVSETIANTFLSSALSIAGVAATDALTGGANSTTTVDPGTGTSTVTQGAINQAVSNIANNITESATQAVGGLFNTRPRVTIPQGTRITVIVNNDIKVPTFNKDG